MELLLSDGITYSIVAYAAIGTDCAENTIPLLFTGSGLVTACCCDSTVLALSEYATILWRVDPLLGNDLETKDEVTSPARQQILNKQAYAAVTE
jgi:hypothetical protein